MAVTTATNPYLNALNAATYSAARRTAQATATALAASAQSLFTVAGGPCYARFFGIYVVASNGTATTGTLQETTTVPAATVSLSTGVALASQANGTSVRFVGATGVLTLEANGCKIIDPVTVGDCWYLIVPGTVKMNSTAANVGTVQWYMEYIPLTPDCVVTAV